MGSTLILPTINAGKEGECARGMAGLVVLSSGGAGGCRALGFREEPAADGAELVQACLSRHCQFQVPRGKACGGALQEGRELCVCRIEKREI